MKNLIFILILLLFSLPVFAEYKPIPTDKQKVFKIEMTKTINKEIPKTKNNINNVVNTYFKETDESIKYTIKSIGINTEIFLFYMKLIDTIEKYVPIKQDLPLTDFYPILEEIVYPYLINNNISTKKIDKLIIFSEKKQKQIGKFP